MNNESEKVLTGLLLAPARWLQKLNADEKEVKEALKQRIKELESENYELHKYINRLMRSGKV